MEQDTRADKPDATAGNEPEESSTYPDIPADANYGEAVSARSPGSESAAAENHRTRFFSWLNPRTLMRFPLVYRLSMLITVLVVTCMSLLGMMIIQHQTQILHTQINELGKTLVTHMASAAKEPLLAEDHLALDVLTTSMAKSDIVLGTAILSLDGISVAQAGVVQFNDGILPSERLTELLRSSAATTEWRWQPFSTGSRVLPTTFISPVSFRDVIVGYTLITFSRSTMEESVQQTVQAITGATLMMIIIGIAMSYAISKRLSRPIDRLMNASRAIGEGQYQFRFNERREDEVGQLMMAFDQMAEGMMEKSDVKDALSRYLSPKVAREVLSNLSNVTLGGKRIDGTVLFADIVGFTEIAENIDPEELVTILNRYFTHITNACEINHGAVDKYVGDGAMLVFGAPEPDPDHCFHAVSCALLIRKLVDYENQKRRELGLFPVHFRLGLNAGSMLAGNMGSQERMEYTVVGDTVNMASRLSTVCNSGEIVISRDLYMMNGIREKVVACEHQSIRLRGIQSPVTTYLVEDLTAAYQEVIDEQFLAILSAEEVSSI